MDERLRFIGRLLEGELMEEDAAAV
jgi:hypothetical protein